MCAGPLRARFTSEPSAVSPINMEREVRRTGMFSIKMESSYFMEKKWLSGSAPECKAIVPRSKTLASPKPTANCVNL